MGKTKAMAPKVVQQFDANDVLGRAVLVNLSISIWEARRFDREITQKVNKDYGANKEAGRWNKHLFGGPVPELSAVQSAYKKLRDAHKRFTLPWSGDGTDILPTANSMAYAEAMREGIGEYREAVSKFITAYPRLVIESKVKLNGAWRASDYPHPNSLEKRYEINLTYTPIPNGSDFRVTLSDGEKEQMAKSTEKYVASKLSGAMKEAWARLGEAVTYLRDRLEPSESKNLRQTMVERLDEIARSLGNLNIVGDPTLEEVRKQVLGQLAAFDVDSAKKDEKVRENMAAEADAILKKMAGYFQVKKGDS